MITKNYMCFFSSRNSSNSPVSDMYQQPHTRGYSMVSMAAVSNSPCVVFALDL